MFSPKFEIILDKKSFNDEFICLGIQFNKIIDYLKNILPPHVWYAADVNAISEISEKLNIESRYLTKVGDDITLVQICSKIEQFLSGVFLAIEKKNNENFDIIEVLTENPQFRSLPVNGVLIEIRVFDTSFFVIYSEDEGLISKLAKEFNGEINKKTLSNPS